MPQRTWLFFLYLIENGADYGIFFKFHATECINFFRFGDGDDPKVYYLDSNSTNVLSLKRHTFGCWFIGI